MPLDRLLTLKPLAAFGLCPGGHTLGGGKEPAGRPAVLVLTAACYFLPDLLTYNNGTKRQARIRLDLPNVWTNCSYRSKRALASRPQWPVSVTSGKGPLAEEMVRTLQDIQAGRTRREAYKAMAERSTVPELKSFVACCHPSRCARPFDARVLKPQADQMRIKRRLRAGGESHEASRGRGISVASLYFSAAVYRHSWSGCPQCHQHVFRSLSIISEPSRNSSYAREIARIHGPH